MRWSVLSRPADGFDNPRSIAAAVRRRTALSARGRANARVAAVFALGLAPLTTTAALSGWVAEARADEARSTAIVVVEPADATDDVARALGPTVRVVSSKKLADALAKRGVKGKLHATLGDPAKKKALGEALRASRLGADQIVVVSIKGKGGGTEIRALSIAAADGASRGESSVVLAANDDRVAGLRRALGVERGSPSTTPVTPGATPSASTPQPTPSTATTPSPSDPPGEDEPPAKTASSTPSAEASDVTNALFAGFVGLELSARRLRYTDGLSGNTRPYDVTGAPSPALGFELFPLARTSVPFVRDLGVVVAGATAVGLSSQVPSGAKVSTRFLRYELGLRYRVRLDGGEHPAALGIEAGYSGLQFRVSDLGGLSGADPSVDYRFLRLGLDARIPLGPVALVARAGVGRLLSVGPMGEQFPRGRGGIFDARLGVAVPFGALLEGRLWVEHTRAFFDFRPLPGDVFVAGGAVDSYSTLHIDVLVHF